MPARRPSMTQFRTSSSTSTTHRSGRRSCGNTATVTASTAAVHIGRDDESVGRFRRLGGTRHCRDRRGRHRFGGGALGRVSALV